MIAVRRASGKPGAPRNLTLASYHERARYSAPPTCVTFTPSPNTLPSTDAISSAPSPPMETEGAGIAGAESGAEGAEPEDPPAAGIGNEAGVAQGTDDGAAGRATSEEDVFGCEDDEGAAACAEGAAAAATCGAPAVEAAEETVVGAATAEAAEELAAGAGDGDAAASRSAPGISNGGRSSSYAMAGASS